MKHHRTSPCRLALRTIPLVLALVASGCATIVTGTIQSVSFNSRPQGAYCELQRNGIILSEFTTPAVATISKGDHDLNVTCHKEGYAPIAGAVPSDMNGWILGNVILGGMVGIGIDLVTGADQKYPPVVTIALHEEAPPPVHNVSARIGPYLSPN